MKFLKLVAAALLACAPAAAQNIATLPNAATLTGAEKMPAAQGTGCATKVQPCANVAISPAAIATYLAPTFQPKDADLDAIAALATQPFGRSLLTQADAASVRSVLGLGSIATQSASGVAITGGSISGITDLAVIDGGTGASTPQAAAAAFGVPWTLAKSGVPASVTGTTVETTLATITIPAGAIGPNGFVEIIPLYTYTSSTNTKTLRIRLGGSEVWSSVVASAALFANRPSSIINNAGNASSQITLNSPTGFGTAGALAQVVRTTINTAAATTLTITGTLATASETITLESYLVRITYGA